ncbi:MAG: CynX/NimT family MFS transporter [Alphaproteobacteria bacterium]
MHQRWIVLWIMVGVRIAIGFQFQAVASVSHHLIGEFSLNFAEIGTMVGLYLLPGIAFALPGGMIGHKFGERRTIIVGLALMTVGGVVSAVGKDVALLWTGRAVCGAGVVMLFIMMTKTIGDWFAGRQLFLAMSIFLNGWPVGMGIALLTQGWLAEHFGWRTVFLISSGICAAALLTMVALYPRRDAAEHKAAAAAFRLRLGLSNRELLMVSIAGILWTLNNSTQSVVQAFGSSFLESRGIPRLTADQLLSLNVWLSIIGVPFGGWIISRYGRPNFFMNASFVAGALVILFVALGGGAGFLFALLGCVIFFGAAVIVTLPAEATQPHNRVAGFGVFYFWWFAGMALLPPIGGWTRDISGDPAAPLYFAAGIDLACVLLLFWFRAMQRRAPASLAIR